VSVIIKVTGTCNSLVSIRKIVEKGDET
jgi:hypothetical protein